MSGFVGLRARKRRRNLFLSLIFIILIGIIIIIYPRIDNEIDRIVPNDSIVPDPSVDYSSLASNIEELELSLFQKDQRIKFRDGQIKNLQIQLKKTKSEFNATILELNKIKNDFNTLLSNNENLVASDKFKSLQNKFNELNIENDKNISTIASLNKKIDDLDTILKSVDNKRDDIINENQKLKKNNKILFTKNIKLDNSIAELKQKIIEQKIEIESYLEQIKNLKDKSHHGS